MKRTRKIEIDLDDFDLLEPNPFELDKECLTQPRLVFSYLKEKAETEARIRGIKSDLSIAIAELKEVDARLYLRIRKNPTKYKLEKVTDPGVANAILTQERHIDAQKEIWRIEKLLNAAEKHLGILNAAAKALDNRKSSLEGLIVLHGRQYYAEPKVKDSDSKEAMNRMHKNRKENIRRRNKQ